MKSICTIACTLCLIFSCTTTQYTPKQPEAVVDKYLLVREQYADVLEQIAPLFTPEVSQVISPKSGRNFAANAYYSRSEMKWNLSYGGYVACRVTLRWEARDWPSVPYGTCQLSGWMYYYPRDLGHERAYADFFFDKKNDHVIRVSKTNHWQILEKGIRVNLN